MARSIEVVVDPAGEIQIEAVGFRGADCEKATAFLERALGRIERRRAKPERYAGAVQNEQRIG